MDSHVCVTPCASSRVSSGGDERFSSCGKTSLVTVGAFVFFINTWDSCKTLGSSEVGPENSHKEKQRQAQWGSGSKCGAAPMAHLSVVSMSSLTIQEVGFLMEVLPELVKKGGKSQPERMACAKTEKHEWAGLMYQPWGVQSGWEVQDEWEMRPERWIIKTYNQLWYLLWRLTEGSHSRIWIFKIQRLGWGALSLKAGSYWLP